MNVTALLLADSRFPGGGHVHSGGVEEAVARGLLSTEDSLRGFLLGRLRTAGELAAVFAAAAAHAAQRGVGPEFWSTVDAELDARTPSAAQREASRTQARATLRALRAADPHNVVYDRCRSWHHAVLVGVAIGGAGGAVHDAALTAAYLSVSGAASAAVRLLGLDPLAVNAIVAGLAAELSAVAGRAAAVADREPSELPAPGAPGLDLLAESHERREVRLFAS